MDRVVKISPDLLEFALTLTAEDRLMQAEEAFLLYHELHRPFEQPWTRGFDRIEDFWKYEEENRLRR